MCTFDIGLLQSVGKRSATKTTSHCEGKVLQPPGRGENQESGRSLYTDGIINITLIVLVHKIDVPYENV